MTMSVGPAASSSWMTLRGTFGAPTADNALEILEAIRDSSQALVCKIQSANPNSRFFL